MSFRETLVLVPGHPRVLLLFLSSLSIVDTKRSLKDIEYGCTNSPLAYIKAHWFCRRRIQSMRSKYAAKQSAVPGDRIEYDVINTQVPGSTPRSAIHAPFESFWPHDSTPIWLE